MLSDHSQEECALFQLSNSKPKEWERKELQVESRGRKRKEIALHGMMGTVPAPIITMTMCAQNAMEVMGGPPARLSQL